MSDARRSSSDEDATVAVAADAGMGLGTGRSDEEELQLEPDDADDDVESRTVLLREECCRVAESRAAGSRQGEPPPAADYS